MSSPAPKPSLAKTWAVFGAAAILLILVTQMSGKIDLTVRIENWQMVTSWFLSLLFGALGITFAIQMIHCTVLSSYWPSLAASSFVTVLASLAFAEKLTIGSGIAFGIIGASLFISQALKSRNQRGE